MGQASRCYRPKPPHLLCRIVLVFLTSWTGNLAAADGPPRSVRPSPTSAVASPLSSVAGSISHPPPDVEVLPIDLPTALRLVDAANPTIAVARERVREAYAVQRQAEVLWIPDLRVGPSYQRHDGQIQNAIGNVFTTSKSSFFIGGGAVLDVPIAEALFAPLAARQLTAGAAARARAVTIDVQLDVALTYMDLLRVYATLAINADTLTRAEAMLRSAEAADKQGLSKSKADVTRARAEVELRREERIELEGQVGTVSARLTQLLLLAPTVDLRPTEPAVVPIA